ncbi:MAG TPA: hypothetical protein PLY87_25270, partial [Planctomycetaceae bacterium]|nr:hypothetical protein [Planctomycetaceae bacterium]HQZ68434.1 hypothetical protein [Planctomycetaceae bacterium]
MSTVWKIAPGDKATVWNETHDQRCITINWANGKDLSRLSKQALEKIVGARSVDQVWNFVHEIQPGDTVGCCKLFYRCFIAKRRFSV